MLSCRYGTLEDGAENANFESGSRFVLPGFLVFFSM